LARPTSRFDYEQATQLTKQLVHQMPKWLRLPFIRSWVFWAIITLGISGGLVYLALGLLLNPRAVPNCPEMFVPMSSASLRVYCGQLAASKQTLPDLVSAIDLVKDISPNDPTRSYVDTNIQRWSLEILRLAEKEYQNGKYDEAVSAVKHVPTNVDAYKVVDKRLKQWQQTWQDATEIDKEARGLLNSSKWGNAYQVAVKLTRLNNRYWATTKYQELADLVQLARADSAKLYEARALIESKDLKNLLKAIEMAKKIDRASFAHTEADGIINTAGKAILAMARTELDRKNWKGAIEFARQVPETAEVKDELGDLNNYATAQIQTQTRTIAELENGIAMIQNIQPNSPIYPRAQATITSWRSEVQDLALLQQARSYAASGTTVDLEKGIAVVQKIPAQNPRGKEAAEAMREWQKQIQTSQDKPYIDAAEQSAASGTSGGLNNAIAQLKMISPGRALYPEAQERIQRWTLQVQTMEDKPILDMAEVYARQGRLKEAVAQAQQIAKGRALSGAAREKIQDWQGQLQAEQNLAAAQRLANTGTPEALLGAIQAAARVPRSSALRSQAREAMNNWAERMLDIAQTIANNDVNRAIAIAKAVPESTSAYSRARQNIQMWQQQLNPATDLNNDMLNNEQ
jgi:hypothetical protein